MRRGLDGSYLPFLACVQFSSLAGASVPPIFGGHSEGETPLPIPNRAVKPLSADGTWWATAWESRSPPALPSKPPLGAAFLMLGDQARRASRRRGVPQADKVLGVTGGKPLEDLEHIGPRHLTRRSCVPLPRMTWGLVRIEVHGKRLEVPVLDSTEAHVEPGRTIA